MLESIKRNLNLKSGIILFIFASLFIFINNNLKKNKPKDISNYVVKVEKGFLAERISSSGEIKARKSINISPRKQGFINSIFVQEGDNVKKNQILAKMDDKDFIYKVEEYKLRAEKHKKDLIQASDATNQNESVLRKLVRRVLRESYGHAWIKGDAKALMLDKEGIEKSDRDNVIRYLQSLGILK